MLNGSKKYEMYFAFLFFPNKGSKSGQIIWFVNLGCTRLLSAFVYKLLHAFKKQRREDIWSEAQVVVCFVCNNSHTYTFIQTHIRDPAESWQKGYLIGVSPRRGDVLSDRIHTLHALQHKRAEQQYYGVHWVPTPSKNISVRVGLTYLFSHIKTQSRVYSDSCCPAALWRTEGELWRSWPSGTIKCNHQTLSWDRLLTHRSKCLLEIIHIKL